MKFFFYGLAITNSAPSSEHPGGLLHSPVKPAEISVDGLEFALEVKAMSNGRNKQAP